MKYTDYLISVFERYNIKSIAIDTADDDCWLATFEFKYGTKKQYKTSRNDMVSYCSKLCGRSFYIENDKDRLVCIWKRRAINSCVRELELNKLLNEIKMCDYGLCR